ncbi:rRNA processing protein gar2 [Paracoccidioides lutzii Pb01]|uniref:RRM domain-containing protein n=1 Tax=Paracoccidioides lutzii (strain ATCC MYA-826 / Pb01) TaxID=502779 RepID=C1H0T5_PARBA|nr:rRNA processing protein gar2 [Paracoccidioides lutzii Pb01]EEH33329.1 hypothetical protein PAAG_04379 [Paracoccidioides lutzii Pb01]
MAVEKKDKKRKAAVTSAPTPADPPSKKSKKSVSKPAKTHENENVPKPILKKSKSAEATNGDSPKAVPVKVTSAPARQIRPRKRAADFLSEEEEEGDREESKKKPVMSSPIATKPINKDLGKPSKKKSKKGAEAHTASASSTKQAATNVDTEKEILSTSKVSKKSKIDIKPSKEIHTQIADDENEGSAAEEDNDDDDQTAALIQGFESSGDEDVSGDEGFAPGKKIPAIPDAKQLKRRLRKMKKTGTETQEPGTIYVGRVPHGFYEHEMRAYFSQFGPITRLRLSRNRTTGRSKHFAFIEFASSSVAQIVADTMDNYLMFGHILKCKFVPQENVHPQLWKGANRRFKKTPWNAIERRRLDAGKTKEQWARKIKQEETRRVARVEKMKELGYEFEMPVLKGVEEVVVVRDVEGKGQGEVEGAEEPAAIEASQKEAEKAELVSGVVEEVKPAPIKAKKDKKEKKAEKKDTPVKDVKEGKKTKDVEQKKDGKASPKDKKVKVDTPEKPGKEKKIKASLAAAAARRSEKKSNA